VRRFELKGLAGLAEGNHSGRPARLSAEQLKEVRGWIRRSPAAAGMNADLWDGKILSACLRKRYRVKMGVRQCQRLFRLGDPRHRLRRPLVAKANLRQSSEHKKNSRQARKPLS
jgi:transposase